MKKIFILLAALAVFACSSDDNSPSAAQELSVSVMDGYVTATTWQRGFDLFNSSNKAISTTLTATFESEDSHLDGNSYTETVIIPANDMKHISFLVDSGNDYVGWETTNTHFVE